MSCKPDSVNLNHAHWNFSMGVSQMYHREASPAASCKKTPATGLQGHGSGVGLSRAGVWDWHR